MSRDPLRALLQMREMALDEARLALRGALDAETLALEAEAAAQAAIRRETQLAESLDADDAAVEALSAWLPTGRDALAAAGLVRAEAEIATGMARAQLVTARAAAEAVGAAIAAKAERAADEALRNAQVEMDEIGQNLRLSRPPPPPQTE